jgi:hypothetical protein
MHIYSSSLKARMGGPILLPLSSSLIFLYIWSTSRRDPEAVLGGAKRPDIMCGFPPCNFVPRFLLFYAIPQA